MESSSTIELAIQSRRLAAHHFRDCDAYWQPPQANRSRLHLQAQKAEAQPGLRGLIAEVTLDKNGNPGLSCGFIRSELLGDSLSEKLGYKFRLEPKS